MKHALPFLHDVPLRQGASRGYLVGRMGAARLIAFREADTPEDPHYGADARWQVFGKSFRATPRKQLETHAETRTRPARRLFGQADK